jgi:hypothetical protein
MSENIILKRIYAENGKASSHINNYFDNFDLHNYTLYDQLNNISQENIIYYIFFGLLLFAFFNKLSINASHILAFLFFIIIIYYFIQKNYGDYIISTKETKNKLDFLNTLMMNSSSQWSIQNNNSNNLDIPNIRKSYLHYNPYIIEFYYNNREMSLYNIESYVDSLTHVNNILNILVQMRNNLANPFQDYKTAIDEHKKCLNAFKSIVFKQPVSNNSTIKLNESISILQSLLMAILKEMEMICKTKNKLNGLYSNSSPNDALEIHTLIDDNPIFLNKVGFNQKYDVY